VLLNKEAIASLSSILIIKNKD